MMEEYNIIISRSRGARGPFRDIGKMRVAGSSAFALLYRSIRQSYTNSVYYYDFTSFKCMSWCVAACRDSIYVDSINFPGISKYHFHAPPR